MELTDDQKKEFRKFSLLLNSLNFEDGVEWKYSYYDSWDDGLDGPFYRGRSMDDVLDYMPKGIEESFDMIRDNFDTGLFYNEFFDSYSGGLHLKIIAEDKVLIVSYHYYSMNSENSEIEELFSNLAERTNPYRRGQNVLTKLMDENFLNQMREKYGSWVELTYDGGGDEGWIDGNVESTNGTITESNDDMKDIASEVLEHYFAGWGDNEGSSGRMKFNFDDQKLTLYHSSNYDEEIFENNYMEFTFE